MKNEIVTILAVSLASTITATETINDSLSVQGDLHIGNYTTRIIGDYNGSPWFINADGRFSFAAHHDWDRSFDVLVPNAEGGQTVEIGQRSKNNAEFNYRTIKFRNADILIGDQKSLFVEGDVSVGVHLDSTATQTETYGTRLLLLGAHNNSDDLWLARYNVAGSPNMSELRVNIGDDASHYGDKFVVGVTESATWHPRFVVQGDGSVGIGTTSPSHKLAVNGTVRAKEVIVDTNWSDFVFEPSYRLRPLAEVERHIADHGHLPDVPSASTVQSNGLSVGEAQKIMMQKIEELTLYVIELKKENEAQQLRIQKLESR